ncbi:MAG TPA: homocysteine S-methyltransferase family protein [Methylomusa anaerophila]|uniref:Methionine synthase n=1 Tax=Methylomusa anaerophila TaxID=1930071 RepID=A0A348AHN4_9FIRM|nr:homocysteine S-methyltransferase family protein [Methylomusa anaerophila]BBB90582.1 methionine synthase [Methylomusa anaerophila]HML88811.1 homocysteine S-methyltransferase family protein [Methylomusa anaerophila]
MIQLFDGAMGTMLQQSGLKPGYCPELWNIEQPEKVTAIHREYVAVGADIIETNTLGANRIKLSHYGLADKVALLNIGAVKAARAACGPQTKIAGSVGPTGKLAAPLGDLSFDLACDVFKEQIKALDEAGADYIIIETIIDIQEMRTALLAAKAVTNKPVICQLTFEQDGRTVTGTDATTAAITLEALGAAIIGANCSLGPAQLLPLVAAMAGAVNIPVSVQPNAGMPQLINGKTIFPLKPAEMAEWVTKLATAGASYIGGCCGTTPDHIKALRQEIDGLTGISRKNTITPTALTSRTRTVCLGPGFQPVIIGERINPTGRKNLAQEIKARNFVPVKKEALAQIEAGAGILDVNMGVPGIDQPQAMRQAVEELSLLVPVPLVIDTTDPAALEAGLKAYPGRAMINSVSAEQERLDAFLPLAKKYGAAILCLPLSDKGVPATATERIEVARIIIDAALQAGLRPHDLLLDALVMTIATGAEAAAETLKTLQLYRKHFGYPAVMGLSNVSYGLPRRDLLNAAFCAMAVTAGLDAPILNPFDPLMQDIWAAVGALGGHDAQGLNYSRKYSGALPVNTQGEQQAAETDLLSKIRRSVMNGETDGIVPLVSQAVNENYSPLTITEQALTAAMNELGQAFGQGQCFLPQVILAAETMRIAFSTIKKLLPAHQSASIGKVLLATVKGDIHDLGKNIVAALLENNGFTVIDLGKDVSPEAVVTSARQHQADIVGLCALMTTTMPQIDITIAALKTAGVNAKTIVGGAVLTADYARQAGADAYAADGIAALNIAKQLVTANC